MERMRGMSKSVVPVALVFLALCAAARAADANLVAHWEFEEDGGALALDSAGDNHGTLIGGPNWVGGQVGDYALNLDGDDDYVDLNAHVGNIEGWNEGTVSGWFNIDEDRAHTIFSITDTFPSENMMRVAVGPTTVSFLVKRDVADRLSMHVSNGEHYYTDGAWHHFAVTTGAGDNRIYIDGVSQPIAFQDGSGSTNEFSRITDPTYMRISSRRWVNSDEDFVNGTIDDVRVYDRALTTEEIRLGLSYPAISVRPDTVVFYAYEGGTNPPPQTLSISNIGGAILDYHITADCSWLEADPNTGSSTGEPNEVTVSVNLSGLAWGVYDCNLTVLDPCAWNNPQVVGVDALILSEGATDFGDCPAPYRTLLADDGARHAIDPNVFLGNLIDEEPNGQPSADANADDANGVDDEDGVLFVSELFAQLDSFSVEVEASNDGFLNAWLDFNIDGDWDDANEQILTNVALSSGTNSLSFPVPADTNLGPTYARFRFSTAPNLPYYGPAPNGEVEDYLVIIEDCYPSDDQFYDQWVAQGKPESWCCSLQPLGDATGDGKVNIFDLIKLKGAWAQAYGNPWYDCRADSWHDGKVSVFDLIKVKSNWGTDFGFTCESEGFDPDDCGN